MHLIEIKLSDEELVQVEDLAACNYSPELVAKYLDVDKTAFMRLWYNKDSLVRTHYDRGQLVAEFSVNQKQKELAVAGNITAAQIFLKESEAQKFKNTLNQVLYGTDD